MLKYIFIVPEFLAKFHALISWSSETRVEIKQFFNVVMMLLESLQHVLVDFEINQSNFYSANIPGEASRQL